VRFKREISLFTRNLINSMVLDSSHASSFEPSYPRRIPVQLDFCPAGQRKPASSG